MVSLFDPPEPNDRSAAVSAELIAALHSSRTLNAVIRAAVHSTVQTGNRAGREAEEQALERALTPDAQEAISSEVAAAYTPGAWGRVLGVRWVHEGGRKGTDFWISLVCERGRVEWPINLKIAGPRTSGGEVCAVSSINAAAERGRRQGASTPREIVRWVAGRRQIDPLAAYLLLVVDVDDAGQVSGWRVEDVLGDLSVARHPNREVLQRDHSAASASDDLEARSRELGRRTIRRSNADDLRETLGAVAVLFDPDSDGGAALCAFLDDASDEEVAGAVLGALLDGRAPIDT